MGHDDRGDDMLRVCIGTRQRGVRWLLPVSGWQARRMPARVLPGQGVSREQYANRLAPDGQTQSLPAPAPLTPLTP
jgi:hypothetical protein